MENKILEWNMQIYGLALSCVQEFVERERVTQLDA